MQGHASPGVMRSAFSAVERGRRFCLIRISALGLRLLFLRQSAGRTWNRADFGYLASHPAIDPDRLPHGVRGP
jgi:hypothetical protein